MYKILLCVAAVLLPLVTAQVKAPDPPAAPPAPEPIPLTQIAPRSEDLTRSLRDISKGLPQDPELTAFKETLTQQEGEVRDKATESEDALITGASLLEIREQLREWRTYGATEEKQRRTLDEWGKACEERLKVLDRERLTWDSTFNTVRNLPELTAIVASIRSSLTEIQRVKTVADQRLRAVLDLQRRVSKQASSISDIEEKLNASREHFLAKMFQSDAPPIWQVVSQIEIESPAGLLRRSVLRFYSGFAAMEKNIPAGAILFLALALGVCRRMRRALLNLGEADDTVARALMILGRPIAVAALIASPLAVVSSPLASMNAVLVLAHLFLLPIVRLLPLYTPARQLVYFLAGFYALNGVASVLDVGLVTKRTLLALIFAAAILLLAWWGRPIRFRKPSDVPAGNSEKEIIFARWTIAALVPIFLANVFGFLLLSYMLRLVVLLCSCFGIILYTLVRVTTTLFAASLRLPRVRSLASVRLHGPAILRWTQRLLKVSAVLGWISVTLRLLERDAAAKAAIAGLLNARPGFGLLNVSLGDILGFAIVLVAGYLIANASRFILREEILTKWRLARGVPETISTSFYYVLLLLVFLMSLSAAGIQLDKLTVLTGALGVGLGFGMQNIVNNFVSGLILQYERPIRVGDVLEVGNLSGEIRRIGIRASTMRTFQGAEVIIPNSTFISGQVVNWTLSEAVRRVDIPVHVAYGTDPERIIKMLLEIARSHTEVLRQPEPSAAFMGFGDSSLDFLLMFWAGQDTHFRLRSEISIRIGGALRDAGIDIPFPQREIRVHQAAVSPMFKQSA